jgi:hypothetical protein
MKYLTPYSLNTGTRSPTSAGAGSGVTYGRVAEVFTEPTEEGIKGINSIRFSPLENTSGPSDEADKGTSVAFPISAGILTIPMVGELVEIYSAPFVDLNLLVTSNRYYYSTVINLWNNPKDNLYFDTKKSISLNPLHDSIEVNPIFSNQGDTLLQGRYGQIIRFYQEQDNGKPRILLSTGRTPESPTVKQIAIDINKTQSSVEFISDGITALQSVKAFTKSHRNAERPKTVNTYRGEQVVVSTGRVVLNSKQDSTLISAKDSISLSATRLNQEADNEICLEAPKIYLGKGSMISTNPEPVLLGNKVEEYLKSVLDEMIGIADSLSTAATAAGEPLPLLNKKGVAASIVLKSLKTKLNPGGQSTLKSKKSFTE